MSLGKVVELRSQTKPALVWNRATVVCFYELSSQTPRIGRFDPFRLQGYTEYHRRKGPNFGRVFLMLNYTDITQNTYIQS